MAGDWIKMRNDLADDPAVIAIAARLGEIEFSVVGRLHALWSWFDEQSRDGHAPGVTPAWLDRKFQRDGFADALVAVRWLTVGPDGLTLANFDHHNGATAKARALTTNRKQKQRSAVAPSVTHESRSERDEIVTREEKRRVKEIKPTALSARPTIPCPYDEIVRLFHDELPDLPKVRLMTPARQRALRKLWGFVLSSTKTDGTRRATNAQEALDWIAGYFRRATENDFLMGRGPRSGEHANWQCDLDFLLTEKGMRHVIEKTRAA